MVLEPELTCIGLLAMSRYSDDHKWANHQKDITCYQTLCYIMPREAPIHWPDRKKENGAPARHISICMFKLMRRPTNNVPW